MLHTEVLTCGYNPHSPFEEKEIIIFQFVRKFCFSLWLKITCTKLSFCLIKCQWNAKWGPLNLQNKAKTNPQKFAERERKTEVLCSVCFVWRFLICYFSLTSINSAHGLLTFCITTNSQRYYPPKSAWLNQLSNCHSQLKVKLNVFWTLIIKYNMTNYLLMIRGTLLQINVLFFFQLVIT